MGAGPERLPTGQEELDRVFGAGIVPGSVTLLGGDPGIGKSTLLLQVAAHVASLRGVLYASGEESVSQVGMRAQRLGLSAAGLSCVSESDLQSIIALAAERKVGLLVVDSIQTVQSGAVAGAAGGVSQLRECTAELVRFAKSTSTAVIIIGHVTKEGMIAGPRLLEHLVDTVLYFESEAGSRYRIVRATKNRFGAVNELGFFAMTEGGLKEVRNLRHLHIPGTRARCREHRDRHPRRRRLLLIELQVSVDRKWSAPSVGSAWPRLQPRRHAVGCHEPPRWRFIARLRRVRERRGRDRDRRDRLGFAGRDGVGLQSVRPGRAQHAHFVWRNRPDRGGPAGGLWRGSV